MKNLGTLKDRAGFAAYRAMEPRALMERIARRKKELGKDLVILVHHYQKPEIVTFADHVADSLELSRIASENSDAKFIVLCGVHFMAESARILAAPHQTVQLPDLEAGCPLADSAGIDQVEEAWRSLRTACPGEKIVPVTYQNSDASLKAFTGKNGGSVCTSSNAGAVLDWALSVAPKVFFFPDEHLGRNTARARGITGEDIVVWNPEREDGGNNRESIRRARLILWNGSCHVHTKFTAAQVLDVRRRDPQVRIVVHPECPEEVVVLADAAGSTSFIVRFVENAGPGSHTAIATEIHLVSRLAARHPDRMVYEVARSLCPNMYRIGLDDLLYTLDFIGEVNVIRVKDEIARDARKALERMLALGDHPLPIPPP
jgi:quinolinate synthase